MHFVVYSPLCFIWTNLQQQTRVSKSLTLSPSIDLIRILPQYFSLFVPWDLKLAHALNSSSVVRIPLYDPGICNLSTVDI